MCISIILPLPLLTILQFKSQKDAVSISFTCFYAISLLILATFNHEIEKSGNRGRIKLKHKKVRRILGWRRFHGPPM